MTAWDTQKYNDDRGCLVDGLAPCGCMAIGCFAGYNDCKEARLRGCDFWITSEDNDCWKGFICNECGLKGAGEPNVVAQDRADLSFGEVYVCPDCGSDNVDLDEFTI